MSTQGETTVGSGSTVLPSWILTSAGASAALVTLGYLVQAARDHLLGVELRANLTLADFGLVGARFLVDVITLVLRTIGLHPLLTPAVILLAGLLLFWWLRRDHEALTPAGITLRLMIIVLVLVGKAVVFDVPTALIENVLVERVDVNRVFDASPVLNWRTEALWRDLICAHAAASTACPNPALAHRRLEATFLLNVIVTVALLTWAGSVLRHIKAQHALSALAVGAGVVVLTLAIAVVALPYQYGKLVAPTTFNEVTLHFRDDTSDDATQAPRPSGAGTVQPTPATTTTTATAGTATATTTATDEEPSERERLAGSALLLASTNDLLTLYYKNEDKIREVSRDDIESVTVYPATDVLTSHITRSLARK